MILKDGYRANVEGLRLRVIAGKLKGSRLAPVRDPRIRPTSDRVKESLFAILQGALDGARFLDLCAGTGSIGIEAHSRGAREVVFVESYSSRLLRTNLERVRIEHGYEVLAMPALSAFALLAEQGRVFDIIFMDPPYGSPLLEEALAACAQYSLLADEGCIVAEHRRTQLLSQQFGVLCCVRNEIYGDTALSFYVWED